MKILNDEVEIKDFFYDEERSKTSSNTINRYPIKGTNLIKLVLAGSMLVPITNQKAPQIFKKLDHKNTSEMVMNFNTYVEKPIEDYIRELISFSSHSHQTKKDIIEKIVAFKTLVNNWDGYGSIPLEVKTATNAIQLLDFLPEMVIGRITDFFPNPQGTINFVWENESHEIVSLEIGNDTMSYYIKTSDQEPRFFNNIEINEEESSRLSAFTNIL